MTRAIHMISLAVLLLLGSLVSTADAAEAGADQVQAGSPLEGTAPDRIIAFGDVHGGAAELIALLQALTLIDQAGNWIGGGSPPGAKRGRSSSSRTLPHGSARTNRGWRASCSSRRTRTFGSIS